MNRKGFTLIEMLAVVVILGILLALAVPSITGYLSKGKEEYYSSLEESIKLAAKDYTTEYRQLLPKVIGNVTIIDLSELTDNDYISNVVDSNGNSCDIDNTKIAVMKTAKNEYEYYTCLNCGEEYSCDLTKWNQTYSENNNVTVSSKDYTIEVTKDDKYEIDSNGNYIVDQGEEFALPNAKAYYNGELVSDSVEPNPKSINTNKLGTTTVTYVYKGKKEEITVEVVDRVAPSIPQVVLRYNNSEGNTYRGNWYSGDIYQEFLSTDYSKQGVVGSEIKKYEISIDKENYTELTGNYNVSTENGIHTYYIRSIDNNNNISDINTYSLKIDKEIPRCELEVKSGTLGTNGWHTSDITIGFKSITEEVSGIVSTKITNSNITTNTSGTTAIGVVQDEAGNIGTCKLTVKLDKTKPTINAKYYVAGKKYPYLPTKYTTETISSKDSDSGVLAMKYEIYFKDKNSNNYVLKESNDYLEKDNFSFDLNAIGTWQVKVKSLDKASNWSDEVVYEYTVVVGTKVLTDSSGRTSWYTESGCTPEIPLDAEQFSILKITGYGSVHVSGQGNCHSSTSGVAGTSTSILVRDGTTGKTYQYIVSGINMGTDWGDVRDIGSGSYNLTINLANYGITHSNSTVQMCSANYGVYCTCDWNCDPSIYWYARWECGDIKVSGTMTSVVATNE